MQLSRTPIEYAIMSALLSIAGGQLTYAPSMGSKSLCAIFCMRWRRCGRSALLTMLLMGMRPKTVFCGRSACQQACSLKEIKRLATQITGQPDEDLMQSHAGRDGRVEADQDNWLLVVERATTAVLGVDCL